ncbi:MAG: hypothetical protein ACE3JP_13860 [Ectobacillus sp.]
MFIEEAKKAGYAIAEEAAKGDKVLGLFADGGMVQSLAATQQTSLVWQIGQERILNFQLLWENE